MNTTGGPIGKCVADHHQLADLVGGVHKPLLHRERSRSHRYALSLPQTAHTYRSENSRGYRYDGGQSQRHDTQEGVTSRVNGQTPSGRDRT